MTVIKSYTDKIKSGLGIQLEASGGVAPYTWSLAPGGVGGSISSTGFYQAPSGVGNQTIIATDDNGETAEKVISVLHPIQLYCDVLKTYWGLGEKQVYIYNQKLKLPPDERLYIAVGVMSTKVFGNSSKHETVSGDFVQKGSVNQLATLNINIMSRSTAALFEHQKLALAHMSDYSLNQQLANGFLIAKIPGQFNNLSEIEGSAIPYRYNCTVNLQYSTIEQNEVSFYDTFNQPEITREP